MQNDETRKKEREKWGVTMNWCNEAEKKKSKTEEIPPPTQR